MPGGKFEEYGPNSGFFEDMHRRYLENPSAVDESWRAFFEGNQAAQPQQPSTPTPEVPEERRPERPEEAEVARPANERQSAEDVPAAADERVSETGRPPLLLEGEQPAVLRGASARIVENMEASLGVP
ncbi:MAG TPA: hypothetical protein VMQ81_12605, partial [Acidimicrobiia bacterium]|nr:hypothetical protein [Acidimicrobiia bacterium]